MRKQTNWKEPSGDRIYQRMTEAVPMVNLKELTMFFIMRLPEEKSRTIRSVYFHYPDFKYFVKRVVGGFSSYWKNKGRRFYKYASTWPLIKWLYRQFNF
jgi:hypothetical protein